MTKNNTKNPRLAKPELPQTITSIQEAKKFLELLKKHDWLYDPDSDALLIAFPTDQPPTIRERRQLNKLMDEVCSQWLPNVFDAHKYFLELQNGKL